MGSDSVSYLQASWTAVSAAEIIQVPGNRIAWHHSDDHPYIYNTETGKLYTGDYGAFHGDVELHPDIQSMEDKTASRYFPFIRGRYNQDRDFVSHFSAPSFGIQEEHLLVPHHKAIEQALGLSGRDGYYWSDSDAKVSNILDPIHDTLDPRVWDDEGAAAPRLKSHLAKWIKDTIYEQAAHFHPEPEKWLRLILTGSLTTYQYSDQSDIDVSLFVSPHFLPEWSRGQLIGLMVKNVDGTLAPGTPFPLQAFVVAKNISPADLYQHGLRSGYDIEQGHWLVPPDRTRTHDVEREYNVDHVYALESADKMERLLRYDPERAVDFWHQIHKRRMRDQSAGKGDYSQANIVYKMLANRGLFPDLAEASGEYIARVSADVPTYLYNKFQPQNIHPSGPDGPEMPFVYDPASKIVHLGPPNSYHHEMIRRTPELQNAYPAQVTRAPFFERPDHLHGRLLPQSKEMVFYREHELDPAHIAEAAQALGATHRPSTYEDGDWSDSSSGR